MRKFIRLWALVAVLMGTAGVASAATPSEFYLGLLSRGTAAYDAARYVDAQKQLSLAAFGLVETVEHYQLAQVYLTLTHDKLSDQDRARESAHRVFLAERVERKYAGLRLPAEVRTAFEASANKLLTSSESGMLLRGAPMTPAPPATQRTGAAATQTPPSTPPRKTNPTTPATTVPQAKPQTSQASASQTPAQPRTTLPEPQTTTAEKTPPQAPPQTVAPAPQPAKPQPAKPTQTATAQPRPVPPPATKPVGVTETDGRGGPVEPPRPAVPAPAPRALTASEVATRLAAAERSLNAGNLNDARRAYRELLGAPGLDHETLIRVAEGLYRARDFSSALSAFNRAGALRRGEEPYRFYIAVALYETGDFARAKKELAAALPYIEITPDVARYKTKIEGSM